MSSSELNVAVCEMTSGEALEENLEFVLKKIKESASNGAEFISFPENCLMMQVDRGNVDARGVSKDDAAWMEIANLAKELQVMVHLGAVPVIVADDVFNTTVLCSPEGKIEFAYSKMHLFDIELENFTVKESDRFRAGDKPYFFDFRGFRFGAAICYDLRFPELFLFYQANQVDVLLLPAAFLVETGKAHWEILLRARAIECQSYVLASAQAGTHISTSGKTKDSFGESMIVDPWGAVLEKSTQGKVLLQTLRSERIWDVRSKMPVRQHRRWNSEWRWK